MTVRDVLEITDIKYNNVNIVNKHETSIVFIKDGERFSLQVKNKCSQ